MAGRQSRISAGKSSRRHQGGTAGVFVTFSAGNEHYCQYRHYIAVEHCALAFQEVVKIRSSPGELDLFFHYPSRGPRG